MVKPCLEPVCYRRTVNQKESVHKTTYHSTKHKFDYKGQSVTVLRQDDGKIPCPCGSPEHARFNWYKVRSICQMDPHPAPENLTRFVDEPYEVYGQETLDNLADHFGSEPYTIEEPAPASNSSEDTIMHAPDSEPIPNDSEDVDMAADSIDPPPNESQSFLFSTSTQQATAGDDIEQLTHSVDRVEISDSESEQEDGEEDTVDGDDEGQEEAEDERLAQEDPVTFLEKWNILYEKSFRRTICLECEAFVPYDFMRAHQKSKHFKGRTPYPAKPTLLAVFHSLRADEPLPIPFDGIPSIAGVKVVPGIQCIAEGCLTCCKNRKRMNEHYDEAHKDIPLEKREYPAVDVQSTSLFFGTRKYFRVVRSTTFVCQVYQDMERLAASLASVPETYTAADSAQQKSVVMAATNWDQLIAGVNLKVARLLVDAPRPDEEHLQSLKALMVEYYEEISSELEKIAVLTRRHLACDLFGYVAFNSSVQTHTDYQICRKTEKVPFKPLQEGSSMRADCALMTRFLFFLLRAISNPVPNFPIYVHPESLHKLTEMERLLKDPLSGPAPTKVALHKALWSLLSQPSPQYLQDERNCPLTRFLLIDHLIDNSGTLTKTKLIPPSISKAQWCLRATAAREILRRMEIDGMTSQSAYTEIVEKWVSEETSCMFSSMRQSMALLSALAIREQEPASLNFSPDYSVLSVHEHPVVISTFFLRIRQLIVTTEAKVMKLFRNCPEATGWMERIDRALNPDKSATKDWIADRHEERLPPYCPYDEPRNGMKDSREDLWKHLCNDPKFFKVVNGKTRPCHGAIRDWLSEVDEVVKALFYLVFVTWGGGARGTEMQHLYYANHPTHTRHHVFFNGISTFIIEYTKTFSRYGHGRLVARTPAPSVSRLLIVVTWQVYWACQRLSIAIGRDPEDADRYLYEIFLLKGRSMTSEKYSETLAEFNTITTGFPLTLQPFRQFMSALLIRYTQSTFTDPDDEETRLAHESFGHSAAVGQSNYGITHLTDLTGIATDRMAQMQRVSYRWHAAVGVIHESLVDKLDAIDPTVNVPATKESQALVATFKSNHRILHDHITATAQSTAEQYQRFIRRELELQTTAIIENLRPNAIPASSPSNSQLAPAPMVPIHPSILPAVARLLGNHQTGKPTKFTSPEQAALLQSVGSPHHILGVLATGEGKSLGFFIGPLLYPNSLFIVVTPLVALTEDLYRRMGLTYMRGGRWGEDTFDPMTAEIVLVGAHRAGDKDFRDWLQCEAIQGRLKRLFIDECHKVVTDRDYRSCFKVFHFLTAAGVPITFLSATMMPRSVPMLLSVMKIHHPLLVHEIRKPTARPNIKYIVKKIEEKEWVEEIRRYVEEKSKTMSEEDRGIIFTQTTAEARILSEALGCDFYISRIVDEPAENTVLKREVFTRWRSGKPRCKCWVAATQAFGMGIDYHSVTIVIHLNPSKISDYDQETGRLGRNGKPAIAMTFYYELPRKFDPKKSEDDDGIDHAGRNEMRKFIETTECVRLVFSVFGSRVYSCAAINGELCYNCERVTQEPYNYVLPSYPRHDLPLVPEPSEETARFMDVDTVPAQQRLVPMNVQINARNITGHGADVNVIQRQLARVLDDVAQVGCADCWVYNEDHSTSTHTRRNEMAFQGTLGTIRRMRVLTSLEWPYCCYCWVPWRGPCGHEPCQKGEKVNPAECKYQIHDPLTKQPTPIIPTLVALIFATLDNDENFVYNKGIANDLGVREWNDPVQFEHWLKSVDHQDDAPRAMESEIRCPVCPEIVVDLDALQEHMSHHDWTNPLMVFTVNGIPRTISRTRGLAEGVYNCSVCWVQVHALSMYGHMKMLHRDDQPPTPAKRTIEDEPQGHQREQPEKRVKTDPQSSSLSSSSSSALLPITPPSTAPSRYKPAASDLYIFAKVGKTVKPRPKVVRFHVDVSQVIKAGQTSAIQVMDYVYKRMKFNVGNCVGHSVLFGVTPAEHASLQKCAMSWMEDPVFVDWFKVLLNAPKDIACYSCYTPLGADLLFQHEKWCPKQMKKTANERQSWEDWWQGVPYLIWRVPALREVVFTYLGVPAGLLDETFDYASWLGQKVTKPGTGAYADKRFTNYVLVQYVFWVLRDTKIVWPEGGFEIPDTEPELTTDVRISEQLKDGIRLYPPSCIIAPIFSLVCRHRSLSPCKPYLPLDVVSSLANATFHQGLIFPYNVSLARPPRLFVKPSCNSTLTPNHATHDLSTSSHSLRIPFTDEYTLQICTTIIERLITALNAFMSLFSLTQL
ncbi:hypothetical protein V5O48_015458 [Marasmius crinis-equi]|uniref:DNA 3'-5' helicase n=1 Tax=Marasmius crinis-equi TaxID=585013 RepID=A0ABR3EUG8_9AGAR